MLVSRTFDVEPKNIKDLSGLGQKTQEALKEVGIETVEQFMAIDPFEIYIVLKKYRSATSLNALYGIIAAQENIPWQQVARERKTEILLTLEKMGWAPK